jgi:hypothetical protein
MTPANLHMMSSGFPGSRHTRSSIHRLTAERWLTHTTFRSNDFVAKNDGSFSTEDYGGTIQLRLILAINATLRSALQYEHICDEGTGTGTLFIANCTIWPELVQ